MRAYRGIIGVAGGPGDRWFRWRSGGRKAAATKLEREESPDTVLRHVEQFADAERRLGNGQRNS